ncbi:MAG: DUF4340 domain-containing protein [Candidatus Omnitrophica bacterium]|nr:DUF4340 domain-containing protein [Candidatus Omnitrophota bacterium]
MKKNLILLLVLILIGAFFYWDRERSEQQKEQEEKEKQLFSISKDEVKEITLVKGDGTFKAVMEGERWKLVQPFEADGDKSAWDGIANSYTSGKHQRVIQENAEDLKPFGLDDPKITASLAGVDGATKTTILFGNETPTSGKYFALIEGTSDVLTVYSSIYNLADKELYDFRDKTIVDMEADEVQKVEIAHGDADLTLERRGENEWVVTQPLLARADEAQIRDLINNVRNGKIKQFIEETPESYEAYGLVDPATKLVFWTGEKNNQSSWAARALLIGGTSAMDHWYAKREGQKNVFSVDPKDFNKVPKDIDSLRSKKITDLRSWEINSMKLVSSGSVIAEATKDAGDWFLIQPESGKANFSSLSNLVRDMVDLEIAEFVQGATEEYGLGQPDIVIELAKQDSSAETEDAEKTSTIDIIELVKEKSDNPQFYIGARTEPLEIYKLKIEDVDSVLSKASDVSLAETPTPLPLDESETEDSSETEG